MKIYNINNKCIKCGGNASITFNTKKNAILRKCKNCGYTWYEQPLDESNINQQELLLEDN